MDSTNSTKRAHAAVGPSNVSELVAQSDKPQIRSLSDLPSRDARTRTETYPSIATFDIPSVDDLKREMHEGRSQQPAAVAGAPALEVGPWHARTNQPKPGSDVTIEIRRPAPRDSAKHRFDELRINFLARYGSEPVKSILLVGTSRGDGASTAAFNFAQSLAQDLDARVLFINADLRAPSPGYGKADHGLSILAKSEEHLPLPVLHGNVHVLPSGHNYADPAVLFQSKRFQTFMAEVSGQFDYIVLDGPPLDEAPESIALCTRVDGVILVIDAQYTRRKIALRAKKRVQEVGGRLLGVVLNRRKYYVPGWLYKII